MIISESIRNQRLQFRVFNTNARKLITANLLFSLFNPFYLIFSSTFIFSSTKGDFHLNLIYNLFVFLGISLGFIFNGYFLRYFHVKTMLIAGAGFLFSAIAVMFFLPSGVLTGSLVFVFGTFIGCSNGVYWSARNYITVVNTKNSNRDFFAGLDFILISLGRIVTPLIVGFYIGEGVKYNWFTLAHAYQSSLLFAFALLFAMAINILPRKYRTTQPKRFLYSRYSKMWNKTRLMISILGLFQGAIMALPPVLILKYVGNETAVGIISSVSYLVAITFVYLVSRRSGVQHRSKIILIGTLFFLTGGIFFTIFLGNYSMLATSVLMGVMFICDPVLNFPFRATFMKVMDELKHIEKRDDYAYLVDVEIFSALGRISGIAIFFLMYAYMPIELVLPIFIISVALLQFFVVKLSRQING